MKTTYEAVWPLKDGKPVPVVERDETGALVGAWIGYWSFKRGTVALYPDVRNKFANWPGGSIPREKRTVSDRYVKNVTNRIKTQPSSKSPSSQSRENDGEGWRERKLPMSGQERIDI